MASTIDTRNLINLDTVLLDSAHCWASAISHRELHRTPFLTRCLVCRFDVFVAILSTTTIMVMFFCLFPIVSHKPWPSEISWPPRGIENDFTWPLSLTHTYRGFFYWALQGRYVLSVPGNWTKREREKEIAIIQHTAALQNLSLYVYIHLPFHLQHMHMYYECMSNLVTKVLCTMYMCCPQRRVSQPGPGLPTYLWTDEWPTRHGWNVGI